LEFAFVRVVVPSEIILKLTKLRVEAPVDSVTCRAEGCARVFTSKRAYTYVFFIDLSISQAMLT
jgi:hypothetical protein